MRNFVYYFVQIAGLSLHFSIAEPIRGDNVVAVEKGEFPFVVALITKTNCSNSHRNFFCTGVLISNRHVLTAAHCLEKFQPNDTQVVLGSVDLTIGTRYNVSKWITYAEWLNMTGIVNVPREMDVAIVKLLEDVDNNVAPAKLSKKTRSTLYQRNVTVLGWGQTSLDSTEKPRYLKKARVTVLKKEQCEHIVLELTNKQIFVEKTIFCTKAEPFAVLSCGDSGGPIVTEKGSVVGINVAVCPEQSLMSQHQINLVMNVHESVVACMSFIKDILRNF